MSDSSSAFGKRVMAAVAAAATVKIVPDDSAPPALVKSVRPQDSKREADMNADSFSSKTDVSPQRNLFRRARTHTESNTKQHRHHGGDSTSKPPFVPTSMGAAFDYSSKQWRAVAGMLVKTVLGTTLVLYVLNQQHLLPRPLSAIVSKTLFWPTLPITMVRRIGTWTTVVDETVIMGGAPIDILRIPERLVDEYGVTGVVNMCKEYASPIKRYKQLGIQELWLPTVDHFEPSLQDLKSAVSFIESFKARGERVYVHCRAGHGRSAAVVLSYLLHQNPTVDARQLNAELCQLRNVRKSLWCQPNVRRFHAWVTNGGKLGKRRTLVWPNERQVSDDDTDKSDGDWDEI